MFAKKIIIFGNQSDRAVIGGGKVEVLNSEQFPRIRDMVLVASFQKMQHVAICNGDILLDPAITKIEQRMRFGNYRCASSRRWHFDPTVPMEIARQGASLTNQDGVDDRGRDVFIARWDVWHDMHRDIPTKYRIGHNGWDKYVTDWFREHHNTRFLDFTGYKIVHHPHHGGRKQPFIEEVSQ